MKIVLLYSDRSSLTGKEFINKFRSLNNRVFRKRTNRRFKSDITLRWGSTEQFDNLNSKIELNTLEAVENASNKKRMMEILVGANIPTAKICFDPSDDNTIDELRDDCGGLFIRGSNGEVRYDDVVRSNDLYISQPLPNKRREYRVHVFNGEVIAIYEKVPRDEEVKLFKAHNCRFELRNIENCRLSKEDQQICINAVNSLGLLFGGVDLMRDKDQNVFVSEVNSAPSLNSLNIDRYIERIIDYCEAMRS